MSNATTGAFGGGPKAAPTVFDYRDRLVILTPVFAYQAHDAWRSCMSVITQTPRARFRMPDGSVQVLPIVADLVTLPNDSHIDRARNVLCHVFLKSEYRFAWFVDSDVEVKVEDAARIWQHLMHGRKFVCGLYAMKTLVPTFVANVKAGAQPDPESGLIELNDGGTGCMAIERTVLDEIRAKFPERAYRFTPNTPWAGETGFAYFTSGVVERGGAGDWLSEDWKFCHDWKLCGGTIWGDTQIKLHHWGPMRFPPTVGEIVEAAHVLCKPGAKFFPPDLAAAALPPLAALLAWSRQRTEQKEAA